MLRGLADVMSAVETLGGFTRQSFLTPKEPCRFCFSLVECGSCVIESRRWAQGQSKRCATERSSSSERAGGCFAVDGDDVAGYADLERGLWSSLEVSLMIPILRTIRLEFS